MGCKQVKKFDFKQYKALEFLLWKVKVFDAATVDCWKAKKVIFDYQNFLIVSFFETFFENFK